MVDQISKLTAAIKNNRPALLLGAAGTGKTAMVHKIAAEHNMPVETLLLAGILPEDMGGLVRPFTGKDGTPTHFDYIPPVWAKKYGDKPFVLFLDEINQAAIQTLHALFYIVNDRTVAGIKLPNMRVIAAGNTAEENEFLTPLPTPLLDRFIYRISWKADVESALKHLEAKYSYLGNKSKYLIDAIRKTATEQVTPRHIEQMITTIEDGCDDVTRGRELVGAAYEVYLSLLSSGERHIEDNRLIELREIAQKLKAGESYVVINGKMVSACKEALVKDLTPEELELVYAA